MNIFFHRFWGFDPVGWPAITFSRKGVRDRLLAESSPGDLLLCVATSGPPTESQIRGRILGVYKFGQEARRAEELFDVKKIAKDRDYGEDGKFRFPFAIPIIRAWRFQNPPLVKDTLKGKFPRAGVPKLSEENKAAILALFKMPSAIIEPIPLPTIEPESVSSPSPSRGPAPSSGERSLILADRDYSYVYWLQFGKRGIWKIGYSHNPERRVTTFNATIPYEVTGEQWEIVRTLQTDSAYQAFRLEQGMILYLSEFSIRGEMFNCSKKRMEEAWNFVAREHGRRSP